jgi:MoaA/NifB/PqqE/SkfB family radical SAM enzyme
MKIREALRFLNSRVAIVAITSVCNCHCPLCNLWKFKYRVDPNKLIANLDLLAKNGFKILHLTGGEPTLLPGLPDIVRAAHERGFHTMLMTNGTTMNDRLAKRLAQAGLDSVGVSVDHYDDGRAFAHRGLPHMNERIKRSVQMLKKNGISVFSSTLLTKSNGDAIAGIIEFVNRELEIPFSFCAPEASTNYFVTADPAACLNRAELIDTTKRIGALKMRGALILNTNAHIQNMLAWLETGATRHACKAGKNVIFVNWDLDVFPCFTLPRICSLEELEPSRLKEPNCDKCLMQCFREPSIYYSARGKLACALDLRTVVAQL